LGISGIVTGSVFLSNSGVVDVRSQKKMKIATYADGHRSRKVQVLFRCFDEVSKALDLDVTYVLIVLGFADVLVSTCKRHVGMDERLFALHNSLLKVWRLCFGCGHSRGLDRHIFLELGDLDLWDRRLVIFPGLSHPGSGRL
jgi:hypothetical protein